MTRAVIVGSGSEIAPTRVTNAQMARIMDTSDEWIRERSGVEQRYFATPDIATSDLGVGGGREGPRRGRRREGRGGPGGLRHHDPRPLLPRLRHAPPAQAGPADGALLRHPAAVLGLPLRAAARGRARAGGPGEDRAPRRGRGAQRLHALDAGELRLRARRVGRAAHEGGVGLEHPLPAPRGPLRRRRRGRRPAGGRGRRPRAPRPRAPRGGRGLREALRARHRLQAPPLHGPRAVQAGRPHPGHGRAPRLQDGHHQHGRGGDGRSCRRTGSRPSS